jgi:hypothetical protein
MTSTPKFAEIVPLDGGGLVGKDLDGIWYAFLVGGAYGSGSWYEAPNAMTAISWVRSVR